MAAMFPHNILQRIAGIICCGTALPPNYNPAGLSPTLYFGIMGRKDFLFLDMLKLDSLLDRNKVQHRIMYFDGWHQWPPEPLLKEAIDAGFQAADVIAEDPDLENIRSEPEYQTLLKKIKLK